MKIVILGSTGYLGCKLTKKLILNHDVLCLKLAHDDAQGLKDVKDRINIMNIDDFYSIDEPFDVLINLSCRYGQDGVRDIDIFQSNLFAPLNVFTKALDLKIKKHITIDTSLPEYLNVYSMSKKKYADIIKWYVKKTADDKLAVVNVILENYYGKDEPANRFIPSTIIKLKNNEDIDLTEGNQKRDWIYVDDVIDALVQLIENNDINGYIDCPLGTGENVEIRTVIEYLKKICKSSSKLNFGSIQKREGEPDTCADISMMNRLNISCRYNWSSNIL